MKQLLIFGLFTSIFFNSFGQVPSKMNAIKVTYLKWNLVSKLYEPVQTKECNITFIISGSTIKADDAAKSVYTTYRKTYHDKVNKIVVWSAVDEDDKECSVSVSFREHQQVKFMVFYENVAISYICYPVE